MVPLSRAAAEANCVSPKTREQLDNLPPFDRFVKNRHSSFDDM